MRRSRWTVTVAMATALALAPSVPAASAPREPAEVPTQAPPPASVTKVDPEHLPPVQPNAALERSARLDLLTGTALALASGAREPVRHWAAPERRAAGDGRWSAPQPGETPATPESAQAQQLAASADVRPLVADPLPTGLPNSFFGWRIHPIFGDRRLHTGLDLAAPAGTPVQAMAAGTVKAAGRMGGYGLAVETDHGSQVTTLYAHLSRLLVRPGDRVTPGDVIGLVGATGNATGPHLHLELRVSGQAIDPRPVLGR